jgi:transcriptional regulator with XRE-family HTH domain
MLRIGRRLRVLRTARKITHRQLSAAVGVTEGTISRIETNASEPTAETMARIADFLGVKMDDLRDDAPSAASPKELEAKLIEAAQRAQNGDTAALLEMRRLASALAQTEGVEVAARVDAKKPVAVRKKGT